jgi:hypothetical protein
MMGKDNLKLVMEMYNIVIDDWTWLTKELRHRKKSKKARKRLVRSILKRRSVNGPFERRVKWCHAVNELVGVITHPLRYEGLAKQVFTTKEC